MAERNVSATMQSTGSAAVTGSDSDRDIGLGDRICISNSCYFQRQHQTQKGGRGAGTCYEDVLLLALSRWFRIESIDYYCDGKMAVYGSRVAYCVRCRPSVACKVPYGLT